jgi:hypothetical protein
MNDGDSQSKECYGNRKIVALYPIVDSFCVLNQLNVTLCTFSTECPVGYIFEVPGDLHESPVKPAIRFWAMMDLGFILGFGESEQDEMPIAIVMDLTQLGNIRRIKDLMRFIGLEQLLELYTKGIVVIQRCETLLQIQEKARSQMMDFKFNLQRIVDSMRSKFSIRLIENPYVK